MDRVIVYPGTVSRDTDILSTNKNAMISDAFIMRSVFGSNTVAAGLACTPGAGLSVVIGPGTLNQALPVDSSAYGSLAADTTDVIVKTGINVSPTTLTLVAPQEAGYSVNYLIQAQLSESDSSPVTLDYYDAGNPTIPYSGPLNSGSATNTLRRQVVQVQTAATTVAAPSGTQTTPAPDSGFVGLWVVTVAAGQTSVASGSISQFYAAPFSSFLLHQLRPGYSSQRVFTSSGTWQVPVGVTLGRVRMWGGGGAGGGGGGAGEVGGGGAGGEYIEANIAVTAGSTYSLTVGVGGAGGAGNGSAGGSSAFGSLVTATGGGGGSAGSSGGVGVGGNYGGSAGLGSAVQGDAIILPGGGGGNGLSFGSAGVLISGTGGGSGYSGTGAPIVAAAVGSSINGQQTTSPGCGGSGGIGSGTGGSGSNGLIVIEW